MCKFIRQTRENFSSLRTSFNKFHDDFQTAEKQFNALKELDVSPKSSIHTHSSSFVTQQIRLSIVSKYGLLLYSYQSS